MSGFDVKRRRRCALAQDSQTMAMCHAESRHADTPRMYAANSYESLDKKPPRHGSAGNASTVRTVKLSKGDVDFGLRSDNLRAAASHEPWTSEAGLDGSSEPLSACPKSWLPEDNADM
ncbi:hypothetical protein CDD83_9228 [Cordyceps sp. RAO-2017]|nr:hypothetical protein CDD83_9228 [Cordyceps sp. RAO-2017]